MADSFRRVQSFRANTDAIHNAMAAEYAESIAQTVQARVRLGVAAIDQEAIGGQQTGRTDKLVRIPPERRAGSRAASAENTLVQTIQFFTLLRRL